MDTTNGNGTAVATREVIPPPTNVPTCVKLGDLAADLQAYATANYEARKSGIPLGPTTGLPKLDKELGGYLVPGLHILHGNTATGKTALALQIAASCGTPCLFVSCEMSARELVLRTIARTTKTYLGRLKSGDLPPEQLIPLFDRACQAAPMLTIADACTTFASTDWIEPTARACKAEGNHLLIVLDSLHAWTDAGNNSNASYYDAINTAIAKLHALAARLEAPILVLCERNRGSQDRGGVNAAANSGRIEYRSETVWGLDRPAGSAPNAYKNYSITLSLDKNRHGSHGQIELQFNGALQQFTEV